MELYRTGMQQSEGVSYQNVVISQDGIFMVENHVFEDDDIYKIPLQSFDSLNEAVDYANAN